MQSDPDTDDPVRKNIRDVELLERAMAEDVSFLERVSHAISDVVGTVLFVAMQILWVGCWAAWNLAAPPRLQFDPYPFGAMGTLLSLEAVLIATFVLIAQNSISRRSEKRDHLTLQITLLAEQEMTTMLRMQREMREHLGVPTRSTHEAASEKLMEDTSVHELMEQLDQSIGPKG